jgi:hypothetical protein
MQQYINHMPRYDKNISRLEDFTGIKPDISQFVPFYEKGVCHVMKAQRELIGGLTFTPKAISCRMRGYGETTNPSMYNTYLVLINNAAYYRHDCYFEHYQEAPSLLDNDELKR